MTEDYKFDPNWEKDLRYVYKRRLIRTRRNKDIIRDTFRADEINWEAKHIPYAYYISYEYKNGKDVIYKKEAVVKTLRGNFKIVAFTHIEMPREYDTYLGVATSLDTSRFVEKNKEFNETVERIYREE